MELVNLRARGVGLLEKPSLQRIQKTSRQNPPHSEKRKAYCLITDQIKDFSIFKRQDLLTGDEIEGPAIVDEGVARTVVHSGQSLSVDEYGSLVIRT